MVVDFTLIERIRDNSGDTWVLQPSRAWLLVRAVETPRQGQRCAWRIAVREIPLVERHWVLVRIQRVVLKGILLKAQAEGLLYQAGQAFEGFGQALRFCQNAFEQVADAGETVHRISKSELTRFEA